MSALPATMFDPGRMIWNGYTGAAGWMFRQAIEGVLGLSLQAGVMVPSTIPAPAGEPSLFEAVRDLTKSPLPGPAGSHIPLAQRIASKQPAHPT